MAASRAKATYKDYLAALAPLKKSRGLPAGVSVILLYGPSEYLLNHAINLLQQRAKVSDALYTGVEATTVTEQVVSTMMEQASLFEPRSLYVVRRCEQAKSLHRLLKPWPAKTKSSTGSAKDRAEDSDTDTNLICFVYKGDAPAAALKTELTRIGAHVVPCFEPWASEAPALLRNMAQEHGLALSSDAVNCLLEAIGTDLVKLEHELTKLALIFADRDASHANKALDAAAIAPYVGLIREDDAFQIDRLLLDQQWAKAQALINNLLDRGDKGIALLGIVANHCRHALKISTQLQRGASVHELGPGLRLPPFLIKIYAQALRGRPSDRYVKALAQCHEVDVRLKSSPVSESMMLATVLDTLAGAH